MNLQQFIEQRSNLRHIRHAGHINKIKKEENTRILVMNPNGLSVSDRDKVQMLINKCREKQIDNLLLMEVNTK